jgi:hypothetical protein
MKATKEMIVDRKNRDALIAAINRYLDGETTAFEFDDEIFGIKSHDRTVGLVTRDLWFLYDDCKDHKVQMAKEHWDYVQRLILILRSDGQIESIARRQWDFTQLVALAALLLYIYAATWFGFGRQLLAVAIPFSVVSIAISLWRGWAAAEKLPRSKIALAPFSSISEMLRLHRSLPKFRKRRCPPEIKPFKIRNPLEEMAMLLHLYGTWLIASPLVLGFQALPTTETDTRVVLGNASGMH